MNITLIGFMGTGKTSVGKRLAKRLGWQFVDVDHMIESSASKPISSIFAEHGEAVFRRFEQRMIRHVARKDYQVIATGGGAFIDVQNRSRLRASGPVICLTARPKVIFSRVSKRLDARPLLAAGVDPLSRIKALMQQRTSAYAQADLTIDTSDSSLEQVVKQVWEKISPYVCKSWQYLLNHANDLGKRYGGKYIVVVDDRIVASGESHLQAYQNASARIHEKCDAGIYYIPLPQESVTAL